MLVKDQHWSWPITWLEHSASITKKLALTKMLALAKKLANANKNYYQETKRSDLNLATANIAF